MFTQFKIKNQSAFTLIEVLIVVTIIAFLLVIFAQNILNQLEKSRDSQRKTDLQEIKISFENYYDDTGQYPNSIDVLKACGEAFENYMKEIPCDPLDGTPYIYDPYPDGSAYRVLARLENEDDKIIDELACGGNLGCGYLNQPQYNYGASQGRRVSDYEVNTNDPNPSGNPGSTPNPTPNPTPSPDICQGQPMIQFLCEENNNPPTCQACGEGGCAIGNMQSGPYRCLQECIQESVCNQ